MRRWAVVWVVLTVLAAPAEAHTLSFAAAREKARLVAERYADKLSDPVFVTIPLCTRRSQHTVDCQVRYTHSSSDRSCVQTIRVRYRSTASRARSAIAYTCR